MKDLTGRTALITARRDLGERALVWHCECGARHAVPLSLVRPVNIRCEKCQRTIDLDRSKSVESNVGDKPEVAAANHGRQALSEFFREAMARGWPVLVAR